jgi:hypothetical protein
VFEHTLWNKKPSIAIQFSLRISSEEISLKISVFLIEFIKPGNPGRNFIPLNLGINNQARLKTISSEASGSCALIFEGRMILPLTSSLHSYSLENWSIVLSLIFYMT